MIFFSFFLTFHRSNYFFSLIKTFLIFQNPFSFAEFHGLWHFRNNAEKIHVFKTSMYFYTHSKISLWEYPQKEHLPFWGSLGRTLGPSAVFAVPVLNQQKRIISAFNNYILFLFLFFSPLHIYNLKKSPFILLLLYNELVILSVDQSQNSKHY